MQAGSEAGALLNLRRKESATAAPRAVSRNGSCVSKSASLSFVCPNKVGATIRAGFNLPMVYYRNSVKEPARGS